MSCSLIRDQGPEEVLKSGEMSTHSSEFSGHDCGNAAHICLETVEKPFKPGFIVPCVVGTKRAGLVERRP